MSTITPVSANLAPSASLAPSANPVSSGSGERAKLSTVAKQFEAIFVRQMLSAARKASFGDDLFGSEAGNTFREMQDNRFADIVADRGTLGLAAQIETHLARFVGSQPQKEG